MCFIPPIVSRRYATLWLVVAGTIVLLVLTVRGSDVYALALALATSLAPAT